MDGYENELLALERYEGKRLMVEGTVEERGLKSRRELQTELGYGARPTEATSKWVHKQYPYVLLVQTGEFKARLLCKYDNAMRKEVGSLQPGQTATIVGSFVAYRKTERGKVVVLDNCNVED